MVTGTTSEQFAAHSHRLWPQLCALSAILCGLVGLSGWALDNAWLKGFGRESRPVHPLSAISYVAIALALLAAMRPRRRLSSLLLAVPATFLGGSLFQTASGIPVPIAAWMFPRQIAHYPKLAGSLYSVTACTIALLTIATAVATRPGRRASKTVIALASMSLGVSLLGSCVVYLDLLITGPNTTQFLLSAPATLQAIFISAALLLWRGHIGWGDLLRIDATSARTMRRVLPFVLLIPAVTALAEIWLNHSHALPPAMVSIAAAAANIFILSGLVFWSMARISDEHEALAEVTHAMDSAPITLTSASGEIQHWSRGCEDLYGWSAEDAIGQRKYALLKTVDAKSRVPLRRAEDVQNADREVIEHRRDGTLVHIVERVRRVEEPGRAPVYAHSMTNISERVAMEAALQQAEANLQMALASHEIGSFDWDAMSGKVTFSPGTEQRLGLRQGEIERHAKWEDCVDPDDLIGMRQALAVAAAAQTERISYKYRFYPPNGRMRSIEGSTRMLYDDQGRMVRGLGVIVDVTDRAEREQALRIQEELFRSALKTVPSAMVIIDERGIIRAFSASAERLFGYATEEVSGSHIKLLAPSAIRAKSDDFIPRYLATHRKRLTNGPRLLSLQRRDGTTVPVELWLGESDGGKNHLFTGFCRDLTERYAAEQRLADMRAELLHVSRVSAMGEMATGLAHELNQPLASTVYFLGAADLILSNPAQFERGRAFVKMASEQALRAGSIIRRMRDFISKEEVDAQAVPIGEVIQDAIALSFVGAAQSDIRLRYDLDPAVTTVLADPVQIQQVFANLLRNAVEELRKCPPHQREITIRTARVEEDMIECSVSDNGPGLDPTTLAQLYKPFVSSKGAEGMGVGLSICRRIVEAHGGTFHAGNNPTGGAIFRFTLPRMDSPKGEPSA